MQARRGAAEVQEAMHSHLGQGQDGRGLASTNCLQQTLLSSPWSCPRLGGLGKHKLSPQVLRAPMLLGGRGLVSEAQVTGSMPAACKENF